MAGYRVGCLGEFKNLSIHCEHQRLDRESTDALISDDVGTIFMIENPQTVLIFNEWADVGVWE